MTWVIETLEQRVFVSRLIVMGNYISLEAVTTF